MGRRGWVGRDGEREESDADDEEKRELKATDVGFGQVSHLTYHCTNVCDQALLDCSLLLLRSPPNFMRHSALNVFNQMHFLSKFHEKNKVELYVQAVPPQSWPRPSQRLVNLTHRECTGVVQSACTASILKPANDTFCDGIPAFGGPDCRHFHARSTHHVYSTHFPLASHGNECRPHPRM